MKTKYLFSNRKSKLSFIFLAVFALQSCGGGGDPGRAPITNPQADTTPEQFTFSIINNAALSTEIFSNFNVVSGINRPAPISILGGEYSIPGVNGNAFTAQVGTIENGQLFQVRLTTSPDLGQQSNVTLTIGDITAVFSVTTTATGFAVKLTPGTLSIPENSGVDTFDIELGTMPNETVVINITNPDKGEVLLDKAQVTFNASNWNIPQTITATSVNDNIIDGHQHVDISLSIDPSSLDSSGYKNLMPTDLPTEIISILDNGKAGVNVQAVGPLDTTSGKITISENAGVGTFNVNLTSQPTTNSTIEVTINNGNPAEVDIAPATITFDSTNWATTQIITATGKNDFVVDADKLVPLTFSVSNASTDVTGYSAVVPQIFDVMVQNVDVAPGVNVIVRGNISLTETPLPGSPGSFYDLDIALQAPPTTTAGAVATVAVSFVSSDPTAALVNNNGTTLLTFTETNWDISQIVRVSSVNDNIVDGLQSGTITISIDAAGTNDTNFAALVEPLDGTDQTFTVADDDTIGVILTPITLGDIKENDPAKTFNLVLNSEPLFDVVYAITLTDNAGSPSTRATIDKASLTFTGATWNIAQTVTVSPVDDGVAAGDALVNINLNITTSDTSGYNDPALNKILIANIIDIQVPDPNAFLQFLNRAAPRNIQTTATATAYYTAVDPNGSRATLAAFKTFNNALSDVENAVYVNDTSLGFGNRTYLTTSPDGTVASCVENYAPATGVSATAQEKINLANTGPAGLLSTLCMEYSATPGSGATVGVLAGRKFVKFFSYDAAGNRISEINLDERGAKFIPGVCNTCHGGQSSALVAGTYPNNGDTNAQFIPWNLNAFVYDGGTTIPATLPPIFKRFNEGVIATYPIPTSYASTTPVAIAANSSASSTITVPVTVADVPITSVVVSIDEIAGGVAGLSLTDINGLGVSVNLISPAGQIYNLINGGQIGVAAFTDVRNLYILDAGTNTNYTVNGTTASGTIISSDTTGFVNNRGACSSLTPIAQTTKDLGCTTSRGAWQLQIRTDGCGANTTLCATPGTLSAWSIHFNGIPNQAYVAAPVGLIYGWYGTPTAGTALPGTYNAAYIPPGWMMTNNAGAVANTETLYNEVIKLSCQSCHTQRGSLSGQNIDFLSYSKFMSFRDSIKSLVFDRGVMPLARRTYQNYFWKPVVPPALMPADILAEHMTGYVAGQPYLKPGRNLANAGISRTVATGSTVILNGEASSFPAKISNVENYVWTVTSPSGGTVTLTGQGVQVSFVAAAAGAYSVTLDTSGGSTQIPADPLTKSTITITAQ